MNTTEDSDVTNADHGLQADPNAHADNSAPPDVPPASSRAAEPGAPTSILVPLFFAALIGGLVGAAASSFFMARHLQAELAMRPPIAVVDSIAWIKDAGHGDTPGDRLRDGAKKLNTTVQTLRSKGVLVLDASSVRSAPPAVVISTPRAKHADSDGHHDNDSNDMESDEQP